jgi:hypothetical protein
VDGGQLNLPIRPQVLPQAKLLEEWEVRSCRTWHDALRMQFYKARTRKNQEFWARTYGYAKGIWNRILNGDQYEETADNNWKRHLNPALIPQIVTDTGHLGIIQWLLKDTPYKLVPKTAAEIDEANKQEQLLRQQEELQRQLQSVEEELRRRSAA